MGFMRYAGSKELIANKILKFIPKGGTPYTEAFGGSISILLKKWEDPVEIINDYNGDIINMFNVFKEYKKNDIIERIIFTPYSNKDFELAREMIRERSFRDNIERAWATYVLYNLSFGGTGVSFGHSYKRGPKPKSKEIEELLQKIKRIEKVIFLNYDFEDFLERTDGPDAVHYLDPPYVHGGSTKMYKARFSEEDMNRLLEKIKKLKGCVIMSSYEKYKEILGDNFVYVSFNRRTKVSNKFSKEVKEILTLNKKAAKRLGLI